MKSVSTVLHKYRGDGARAEAWRHPVCRGVLGAEWSMPCSSDGVVQGDIIWVDV